MSESIWLRESDPLRLLETRYPMRGHDSAEAQERKSRLYLLACARKRWARLPGVCRALVTVAELYTDSPHRYGDARAAAAGIAADLMNTAGAADDLTAAEIDLSFAGLHGLLPAAGLLADVFERAAGAARGPDRALPLAEWRGLAALVYLPFERLTPTYTWVPPELHDLALLHEVYGNPYRHTPFSAQWRTNTVALLAQQMYESRDFAAAPILADALQDAGCDSDDILNHFRDPRATHVRGCWALDLVLGKK